MIICHYYTNISYLIFFLWNFLHSIKIAFIREALDRKRRDFCTEISAIEILMNFAPKFRVNSQAVTNERTTLQNAFLPGITRGAEEFFVEIFTSSLEAGLALYHLLHVVHVRSFHCYFYWKCCHTVMAEFLELWIFGAETPGIDAVLKVVSGRGNFHPRVSSIVLNDLQCNPTWPHFSSRFW